MSTTSSSVEDVLSSLRAAQSDERLSCGALYGLAIDTIEMLRSQRDEFKKMYGDRLAVITQMTQLCDQLAVKNAETSETEDCPHAAPFRYCESSVQSRELAAALADAFDAAYEAEWDRVAESAAGSSASGVADRAATIAGIRAVHAALLAKIEAADRLAEGVETTDRLRIAGAYGYVSDQVSDAIIALRALSTAYRTGQQPAQPDYDPIAAVEAVEHYEASAKALDALDSLDAQPGSGKVKKEPT